MTDEVARVALLALTYRELAKNYSVVGPRVDGSEIVYDLDSGREDVSLLTLLGSNAMGELDWIVVRAFDRPDVLASLTADLVEVEPVRAEAILHAIAEVGDRNAGPVPTGRALAAAERWEEVEEAMDALRDLGIAGTRDEVFEMYVGAMQEATGRTRDKIVYDFVDETTTMAEAREGAV
jgi:hypothetical protein